VAKSVWLRRPSNGVAFSLLGGLLILVGSVAMLVAKEGVFANVPVVSQLLSTVYTSMQLTGFGGGPGFIVAVSSNLICGVVVIIAAMTIHFESQRAQLWGEVIIAFSAISLIGTGGFFIGAILGIIGGSYLILRKRSPPKIRASRADELPDTGLTTALGLGVS
jgi:hypothetical protein